MTTCNPSLEVDDHKCWTRWLTTTFTSQPSQNNNSDSSPKNTTNTDQTALWSKEMDLRDPLLDSNTPTGDSMPSLSQATPTSS